MSNQMAQRKLERPEAGDKVISTKEIVINCYDYAETAQCIFRGET